MMKKAKGKKGKPVFGIMVAMADNPMGKAYKKAEKSTKKKGKKK